MSLADLRENGWGAEAVGLGAEASVRVPTPSILLEMDS